MNINPVFSSIEKIDRVFDYVPLLGNVSNLLQIFQKCILFKILSEEKIHKNHYFHFVYNKPLTRCILLLIPILGNFVVAFYDFAPNLKILFNQPIKKDERDLEDARKLTEEVSQINKELEKTRKELTAHHDTIETIKTNLKCEKCARIVLFPLVVGKCGHIACQSCLDESLEVSLQNNRITLCPSPLCGKNIVAMPVQPQQAIAAHVRKLELELNPDSNQDNLSICDGKLNSVHERFLIAYRDYRIAIQCAFTVYTNLKILPDYSRNEVIINFKSPHPNFKQIFYDHFHKHVSKDLTREITFDKAAGVIKSRPSVLQIGSIEPKKLKITVYGNGEYRILADID